MSHHVLNKSGMVCAARWILYESYVYYTDGKRKIEFIWKPYKQ